MYVQLSLLKKLCLYIYLHIKIQPASVTVAEFLSHHIYVWESGKLEHPDSRFNRKCLNQSKNFHLNTKFTPPRKKANNFEYIEDPTASSPITR